MGLFSGITSAIGRGVKALAPHAATIAGAATGQPWMATLGNFASQTVQGALSDPVGLAQTGIDLWGANKNIGAQQQAQAYDREMYEENMEWQKQSFNRSMSRSKSENQKNRKLSNQQFKKSNQMHRNQVRNMVTDATKAGINPHFAMGGMSGVPMGGGGGGGGTPSAPSLMAPTTRAVSYDALTNVLTGDAAAARKRNELAIDLMEIEKDTAIAENKAGVTKNKTSGGTNSGTGANVNHGSDAKPGMENPNQTITDPYYSQNYVPFPFTVDAETAEANEGEPGGVIRGLGNIFNNHTYNAVIGMIAKSEGKEKLQVNEEMKQGGLEYYKERARGFVLSTVMPGYDEPQEENTGRFKMGWPSIKKEYGPEMERTPRGLMSIKK